MATLNQAVDLVIQQICTTAVAAFPVVQLTGASARRFNTALAANVGTNKAITDENGSLLAVTQVSNPTYFTVLGTARKELESSEGSATTF